MAVIKPFRAVCPAADYAADIAALPYDVYNRAEAKHVVERNPLSFLKIDRAETQFPDDTDMYSQSVYDRARDTLQEMTDAGYFMQDESPCYYLYALTFREQTQTGIVCCASIDDYLNGVICRHENTLEEKETDRIRHIDTMDAQTGPIFLVHRPDPEIHALKATICQTAPLYDFVSTDGVRHQVWLISDAAQIAQITEITARMQHIYIADGHHRAASAVKVGLKRREEHPGYDGSEEFNYFLSVLFPEDELRIFDYNRVVDGLHGHSVSSLLGGIQRRFDVIQRYGDEPYRPQRKGEIGMYLNHTWYTLTAKPVLYSADPVRSLDVSILQNEILEPLLGIQNPKTDPRIHFIGGIRGLEELVRMTDSKSDRVAFAMYPTSMEELLSVADAGRLMPPKSTWFEPKLRSGLFIHPLE